MLAPLRVPRLTRVNLIAQPRFSTGRTSPVLLMTVELGQGPYKEVLTSSENGVHVDAASGIRIEDLDLWPEMEGGKGKGKEKSNGSGTGIWIVIERIGGPGGQVEDHLDVEVLAEERVDVGDWIVDD